MAWWLLILGRPALRAGGASDLRAFQNAFLKALALAGCVFLLILTTPFLADYAVMNLVLFLICSYSDSSPLEAELPLTRGC